MSTTITSWLAGQLILASLGVTLLLLAALLLSRPCRADPVACHRHLVAFLPALLLVIPIQIVAPALIDWPDGGAATVAAEGWHAIVGRPQVADMPSRDAIASMESPASVSSAASVRARFHMPGLLLAGYGAGCVVLLSRRVQCWVATRQLLAGCAPVHSPTIIAAWRAAAAPLQRRGGARLLQHHQLSAPACCRWWRPAVIVPADAAHTGDSASLRFALLHEVEHLRRRDWLVASVQSLVVTLYWFHPLVWMYSRALDQQRELSCDALVVRRTGQARGYALALIDYCERQARSRWARPGQLLTLGSLNSLSRRIHMLARTSPAHAPARGALALVASLACTAVAIAAHASIAAAAQDQPPAAESKSVAIKTLKQESGAITSAQVDAAADGRDPMDVIRMSEMHGHAMTSGWITSQETLASAPKAAIKDNVLLADTFNVNLPEGSKLKAVLTGARITAAEVEGKTRITIERGRIDLFDEQGVKRVSLRAEPADASFVLDASMEAGEVAFVATTSAGGAKLRLEFDRTTGVPKGEAQPPHGAVRYELLPAGNEEDARARLKMQWIYDVEQVLAAERGGAGPGR